MNIQSRAAICFFDDKKYDIMKKAGYFIGYNTKYLGEGGVEITEKTKEELILEQNRFEKERQNLLNKGYKLFKSSDVFSNEVDDAIHYFNQEEYSSGAEWKSDVNSRRNYLLRVYGLYLVTENEIQNLPFGTLLVPSIDGKEVIYDGKLIEKSKMVFQNTVLGLCRYIMMISYCETINIYLIE